MSATIARYWTVIQGVCAVSQDSGVGSKGWNRRMKGGINAMRLKVHAIGFFVARCQKDIQNNLE